MVARGSKLVEKGRQQESDSGYVESVTIRRRRGPLDTLLVVCWALILIKCVAASWAIRRWDLPIHDFYIWGPSLMFAGLCTVLYLSYRRRRDQAR
jgi:hypothetical protein